MNPIYRFRSGDSPLLISVPHDGREIPADLAARMTAEGRAIPDTDWHVARLYEFAVDLGASILAANYSRYVVDLNRPADDASLYEGQVATGLCPEKTFAGAPIYRSGGVDGNEKRRRAETYWHPYHGKIGHTLNELKARHGYALLWDAHSIPSVVPRLFDGELPVLNLGSNASQSCDRSIENAVAAVAHESDYSAVINGRFKGGHITRSFGEPDNGLHALQLEVSQRAYMNEDTTEYDDARAAELGDTLRAMLDAFLQAAKR